MQDKYCHPSDHRGHTWEVDEKANWERFIEESDTSPNQGEKRVSKETLDNKTKQGIPSAAAESILKRKGRLKKKVVAWRDDKCKEVVRRYESFKLVKRTHNFNI